MSPIVSNRLVLHLDTGDNNSYPVSVNSGSTETSVSLSDNGSTVVFGENLFM